MCWITWEPPVCRPKFCQRRSSERLSLRMLAPRHPSTMDSHHPGTRHGGLALGTCHASPPDVKTVEDVADIWCIWLGGSSQTQRWTNLNKHSGSMVHLLHFTMSGACLKEGFRKFPGTIRHTAFICIGSIRFWPSRSSMLPLSLCWSKPVKTRAKFMMSSLPRAVWRALVKKIKNEETTKQIFERSERKHQNNSQQIKTLHEPWESTKPRAEVLYVGIGCPFASNIWEPSGFNFHRPMENNCMTYGQEIRIEPTWIHTSKNSFQFQLLFAANLMLNLHKHGRIWQVYVL